MLGYWIFMLIMCLLTPALLIPVSKLLEKSPPANINRVFGYRSNMSMKNAQTWVFAHQYWGKKTFVFGLLSVPLQIILMLFCFNTSVEFIAYYGMGVMVMGVAFVCVPTIIMTEKALNARFNRDGTRKMSIG